MERHETTYYRIGDVVLKVVSDLPYKLPDGNASDFRIDYAPEDYTYRFRKIEDLPDYLGKTHIIEEQLFSYELVNEAGKYCRGFYLIDQIYDSALELGQREGLISYISYGTLAERYRLGFNFTNYFALEQLYLRFGSFVLHSSHINVNGRALVFSAPSGTGKSTQAALWEEYAGAEIINGDRTLLRKKDGVWNAYGCPMCGTSGIHKQGNEPIHAIVMLSQGTDNAVKRLKSGEAFFRMYPEITVPRWNRELVLRAMELLDDVMANVPVYSFSCTKDERAVHALREALNL